MVRVDHIARDLVPAKPSKELVVCELARAVLVDDPVRIGDLVGGARDARGHREVVDLVQQRPDI
jgi:hypothetical protein